MRPLHMGDLRRGTSPAGDPMVGLRVDGEPMRVIRLGWPVSNVWLLPQTAPGPVLVDAGFGALWPELLLSLRLRGLRPRDLAAVVLTHHHPDHAGNAARLTRLGVPVYAHTLDAAVLSGRACRPVIPLPGREQGSRIEQGITTGMCLLGNRYPSPRCEVLPLEHGDEIAGMRVHWMPGHTTGSLFLHHERSGALFSGDGLINAVPPLTARTELSLPYPTFCEDYSLALRSLAAFVERGPRVETLYAGHGPPRQGRVLAGAAELLDRAAG